MRAEGKVKIAQQLLGNFSSSSIIETKVILDVGTRRKLRTFFSLSSTLQSLLIFLFSPQGKPANIAISCVGSLSLLIPPAYPITRRCNDSIITSNNYMERGHTTGWIQYLNSYRLLPIQSKRSRISAGASTLKEWASLKR